MSYKLNIRQLREDGAFVLIILCIILPMGWLISYLLPEDIIDVLTYGILLWYAHDVIKSRYFNRKGE